MSKHSYYNDWVLPVVTTFLGVFAAAYLTIWYENRHEDESTRMLLEVAHTDACSSLATAESAQLAIDSGAGAYLAISEPKIMLAVFQDNAKTLATFHPQLATSLVRYLADIERSIGEYRHFRNQLRRIERIAPFLEEEGAEERGLLEGEGQRALEMAQTKAGLVKNDLAQMAFLLEQQLMLMRGDITAVDVEAGLSAIVPDVAPEQLNCDTRQ